MSNFYEHRSQKKQKKKTDGLTLLIALFGSVCVKAAHDIGEIDPSSKRALKMILKQMFSKRRGLNKFPLTALTMFENKAIIAN